MYVHIGHRFKRRENQILIQRMRVNALVLQLTTKMKICFIAYYYYTRGKKPHLVGQPGFFWPSSGGDRSLEDGLV